MSEDAIKRKNMPIFSGVLNYFPDALLEVSRASKAGNDQHHPDKPLHWDKSKSFDHGDALMRHLIDAGKIDGDGVRHSAKVAWRALALLQIEIEKERQELYEEDIIKKSKEDDIMYPSFEFDGPCEGELGSHPLCSTDYCPCKESAIDAEIEREKRMNIIGQNGNDGLHYDEISTSLSAYPESNWTENRTNEIQKTEGKENRKQ